MKLIFENFIKIETRDFYSIALSNSIFSEQFDCFREIIRQIESFESETFWPVRHLQQCLNLKRFQFYEFALRSKVFDTLEPSILFSHALQNGLEAIVSTLNFLLEKHKDVEFSGINDSQRVEIKKMLSMYSEKDDGKLAMSFGFIMGLDCEIKSQFVERDWNEEELLNLLRNRKFAQFRFSQNYIIILKMIFKQLKPTTKLTHKDIGELMKWCTDPQFHDCFFFLWNEKERLELSEEWKNELLFESVKNFSPLISTTLIPSCDLSKRMKFQFKERDREIETDFQTCLWLSQFNGPRIPTSANLHSFQKIFPTFELTDQILDWTIEILMQTEFHCFRQRALVEWMRETQIYEKQFTKARIHKIFVFVCSLGSLNLFTQTLNLYKNKIPFSGNDNEALRVILTTDKNGKEDSTILLQLLEKTKFKSVEEREEFCKIGLKFYWWCVDQIRQVRIYME